MELQSSSFSSLQDLCLYSLVGGFEEYSSQSLSLLPTTLRRQLLLRLPVADIMKVENDAMFMRGLDPDSVWSGLFMSRLVPSYPSFSESVTKHTTAKEYYLSEVALYLLTSVRGYGRYSVPDTRISSSHIDMINYMLFGMAVESHDGLNVSHFSKKVSKGATWLLPIRHVSVVENVNDHDEMVQEFLNRFNWYPETIDLTEDDHLLDFSTFECSEVFEKFLSKVNAVCLTNEDYSNYSFPDTIKPLWDIFACLETCALQKVTLLSCVTNLNQLISVMVHSLFRQEDYYYSENVFHKFSGLKHIEILGNDGGTHPHEYGHEGHMSFSIYDSIPFIDYQIGLETLIVEGMLNIVRRYNDDDGDAKYVSIYDGFEHFYNYLPYFIRKPSFKLLNLSKCTIPINSIKSMISTFLAKPTDHDLNLKLLDCDVADQCTISFSEEFPLINQDITNPCVCGTNKSLSLTISPLLPLNILFDYPMLQLKRLELSFQQFGDLELEAFKYYPKSRIDTLSCCFKSFCCTDDSKIAVCKFFQSAPVCEIEIIHMGDDSLISVLSNALMDPLQLTSLRRICLKEFFCRSIDNIRTLFNAIFSRPKDQLAMLSLEIIELGEFRQQYLLDSWKANGRGNKLKSLVVVLRKSFSHHLARKLSELTQIAQQCRID